MNTFLTETGETHKTCGAQDFDKFFAESQKNKKLKTARIPLKHPEPSYCTSWVNEQSFEVNRSEESTSEVNLTSPLENSGISSLPESVKDCHELTKKLGENRRKFKSARSRKSEKSDEPAEKRQKSLATKPTVSLATVNFFESMARATSEIRNSTGNSKWRLKKGIYIQQDDLDSTNSSGSKSEYEELMELFANNVRMYDSVTFEHAYSFDWEQFAKNGMQYVIFTKVCQSHPPGYFIEMRKEATHCHDCEGTDLAVTVRLTIPLNLSEIAIPADESLGIHVAFVAKKLPGFDQLTETTGIFDFSRETCERMYKMYRKMLQGTTNPEYTQWFGRCREFARKSLEFKKLQLFHGRVVRRKFEEIDNFKKRRCFVFADIFEFE